MRLSRSTLVFLSFRTDDQDAAAALQVWKKFTRPDNETGNPIQVCFSPTVGACGYYVRTPSKIILVEPELIQPPTISPSNYIIEDNDGGADEEE